MSRINGALLSYNAIRYPTKWIHTRIQTSSCQYPGTQELLTTLQTTQLTKNDVLLFLCEPKNTFSHFNFQITNAIAVVQQGQHSIVGVDSEQ